MLQSPAHGTVLTAKWGGYGGFCSFGLFQVLGSMGGGGSALSGGGLEGSQCRQSTPTHLRLLPSQEVPVPGGGQVSVTSNIWRNRDERGTVEHPEDRTTAHRPTPPTPAWRSSSSSSRLGEGGSRSSDVNKRTSDINAVSFFCLEMDDGGETSVVLWPHGGAGGRS